MEKLISPAELAGALSGLNPPVVIDVRREEAYRAGHIPGARHIPGDALEASLDQIPRDRPVVTY
ncbi:MAG TPA: rhodanese-like domain-containing protein [Anaerolineae bacterium]|nr:rhodanese-like domain-containing protein [Anaerolineae bacterium]